MAETAALLVLTLLVVRVAPRRHAAIAVGLSGFAVPAWLLRFASGPATVAGLGGYAAWALLALLAVAVGFYLRSLDRRRSRAVVEARQAQRLQLARDLHDFVAHDISGMLAQAQAGQILAEQDPAATAAAFGRIEQTGRQALASMDHTVRMVHDGGGENPGVRACPPTLADLPEVVARFTAAGTMTVQLDVDPQISGHPPTGALPRELTGRQLAASLAWLWHLDRRGREGIGFLHRAIDRAPDERSRLQARLMTGLALVADTAGPLDVEHDAASRALTLATDVGDEGLRALCLNLLAVGSFYTDFDEAWRLCEQAHAAAHAGGNTFVLGGARALQAMILHLRDRHAEAEGVIDESVRQCLQHHRGVLSTLLTYQADGALAGGDPARALDLAAEALLVAEPLGDYLRVGMARSVLAQIKALTGDLAGATEVIDPVLRLVEGAEDEVFIPGLDHAMAALSMRRDDPPAAIDSLRRAARSTDRGATTWLAGRALPRLGAALAAAGRPDEAVAALDRAVEVARGLRMPGPLAEAYAAQAELAAADPDGLTRAVELHHAALTIRVDHRLRTAQLDSLEALARVGAAIQPTPDDVRILYAAGSARTNTGLPRGVDLQRAYDSTAANLRRALGATAFDRAAAEGARLTLDQGVEYARRARGRRGRPAAGWSSLTPTELEVVRLVAEGLTNPQIGARLLMSRGTVKTYLSHIFTKLDTTNRAQLAAAATDRGLSPDRSAPDDSFDR